MEVSRSYDEFSEDVDFEIHNSVYSLLSDTEIGLLNQDLSYGDPLLTSALSNYGKIRLFVETSFNRAERIIQ
jgi:hypothetical protein